MALAFLPGPLAGLVGGARNAVCGHDEDRQYNPPEGPGHRQQYRADGQIRRYIWGMRKKKRVLWEVRVFKASAVLVGTIYAPDEKTARKAVLKELTVRAVDQNRLLIRRTP